MKKIFLIFSLMIGCYTLSAQVNYEYMKAADAYYANGDYFSAIKYYEKALGKGKIKSKSTGFSPYSSGRTSVAPKQKVEVSDKDQALLNLAESYRKLHYHEKALPLYQEVVQLNKFPLAKYHYATTLRALQKNDEAEVLLEDFINSYDDENDYLKESAKRELASLQYQKVQSKTVDMSEYAVSKVEGLADTGGWYAPVWIDNTVYYTSTKPEEGAKRLQVNNNRVYQAGYTDGKFGTPVKVGLPEENDIHQGVVTFSPDGNKVIFNRWTIGNGTKSSSLYISKLVDGKWTNPVGLPEAINVPGYNAQQAFWMNDGKTLLFVSDMPGGYGGFDLWSTTIDELDNATAPMNLGSVINTANDEHAPYYHDASGTLVFSSNGRVGMGGLDFYYVKGRLGSWGEVVNFGAPLNSPKDDVYFTSKGSAQNILENVLFSSDRDASCCLEIFALQRTIVPKVISGVIVNCETKAPISGAKVVLVDVANNATLNTVQSGTDGSYSFTVDTYAPFKVLASNEGYISNELQFNEPADRSIAKLLNPDLCLEPIVVEKPVVVNNVYYDFNKSDLRPESHPELDKLVAMFEANPNIKVEISAHTDSKGSDKYNQRLSDARAKSVVDYLVSKGVKRESLIAKGYGASQPVADNTNEDGSDNPEGRQMNRRTEFKVISQ